MAPGERYKGHDELLETFPTVIAAQPSARLVLAGDGADRDRLVAKAAELGLSSRVEFPGFVDDDTLGSLYERCALFAMPSRGEGFGLVYLEAMRSAKPCLAARGSAAEEVVIDGETGLLVDPDDREELATALVRLLANPELASRMGERGQERWRREFRPEAFDRRYHPLLERLTT